MKVKSDIGALPEQEVFSVPGWVEVSTLLHFLNNCLDFLFAF